MKTTHIDQTVEITPDQTACLLAELRGAVEWWRKFHGDDPRPIWLQRGEALLTEIDQATTSRVVAA